MILCVIINKLIKYNIFDSPQTMFKKCIVVDAKGHMMGRLASYVAKELLNGTCSLTQASKLLWFVPSS